MKIIPAIDIIDGKCVRLTQGDYATKKIYNENPVEVAKQFEAAGIEYLHVVDLDGAKSQHIINHKTLNAITAATKLKVDFGGGIKSDEDIRIAFDNGANQITAGSIAVKNRDLVLQWGQQYGFDKIIIGADVKDEQIAINGWQQSGNINMFDFLKDYLQQGFSYVICTDIAKDGMLQGPSLQLYKKVLSQFPDIKLIASGGVTTMNDVSELTDAGIYGAIIGKAIYEGTIDINQLVKRA